VDIVFGWMGTMPWFGWAVLLFLFSIALGIFAVLAGIGGGVLFVPIIGSLFPFHLDFVRGAGLIVALAGALSATPRLLKKGLASLKLTLPLALFGSAGSIAGASVGFALPVGILKFFLGIVILSIVVLMYLTRRLSVEAVEGGDSLSRRLGLQGWYYDQALELESKWYVHRTIIGMLLFIGIGFLGGMFGLGAGWANFPVLHLVLGVPTKIAVATSLSLISINSSAASWVYLNEGAVLPLIAVPSAVGMMLGSRIGAQLLPHVKPKHIRVMVIIILFLAGLRMMLAGISEWGTA